MKIIECDNLKDYENEKSKLYLEFENIIKKDNKYQNEILAVEKKYFINRKDILETLFLAHIEALSIDWYEEHIYYKGYFDWCDLIIKWAKLSEKNYQFSNKIVWSRVDNY